MECVGGGGDLVSWEWRFWQGGASVARGRRRRGRFGGRRETRAEAGRLAGGKEQEEGARLLRER